jgi:hypothetical protein
VTFCEIYYAVYESDDDKLWSRGMLEVKRMKRASAELYACWTEYVNRSLERNITE